ncbi:hypothetical protein J6590_009175 [Homalodisca vitripennis]|nr:hypothetical protein J6590_009175 [Homalodisca vitripennis]
MDTTLTDSKMSRESAQQRAPGAAIGIIKSRLAVMGTWITRERKQKTGSIGNKDVARLRG